MLLAITSGLFQYHYGCKLEFALGRDAQFDEIRIAEPSVAIKN